MTAFDTMMIKGRVETYMEKKPKTIFEILAVANTDGVFQINDFQNFLEDIYGVKPSYTSIERVLKINGVSQYLKGGRHNHYIGFELRDAELGLVIDELKENNFY